LKRKSKYIDLNQIGFTSRQFQTYENILNEPSGVILVTGPTGSGKTTTLYASLNYINDQAKKIITVEDPVEYSIDGVIQGKFNPKIGLTYPEFIKSMMRQDPDVLMIGEIRDRESAEATVNASLTGHKVFSTFHTEDSVGALLRLMDMGIEPYLISSTVKAVLSQRLVRVNCPFCSKRYEPSEGVLSSFNIKDFNPKKWEFVQGQGCQDCNGTGYHGRTGIHELLVVNDNIRRALINQCTSNELLKIARETAKLVSKREYGFYKAIRGITTPEEILRVVYSTGKDDSAIHTIEDIIELCEIPSKHDATPSRLPKSKQN
jgi:type IV pilus assembly protein PilB